MNTSLRLSFDTGESFVSYDYGRIRVWFSYREPIAIEHPEVGTIIRKRYFSRTTERHKRDVLSSGNRREVDETTFQGVLSTIEMIALPIPYEIKVRLREAHIRVDND